MPDRRPTRIATTGQARQRARAATRERILAAAAEHLALYGSDRTTILDVATLAAVAPGTVYLHFPDREALVQEVLTVALGRLKLALAEAASGRSARSLEADVQQRVEGLVAFAGSQPHLAAVLFDRALQATAAGLDTLEFLVASQAAALAAARDKGWVRADLDPDLAGRALVGATLQLLGWWVGQRAAGAPAPDAAQVAATITSLRLYGTAARPRE